MSERPNLQAFEQCPDCACLNLRKASRAVTQLFDQTLKPSGIRATQFSILVAALRRAPVTITRLAQALVMDRTTLTRDLRPLEAQGFIQVSPGSDRRTRTVTLTARGREVVVSALPLWEQVQARMVEGLGPGGLRRLLGDTSRVVAVAQAN